VAPAAPVRRVVALAPDVTELAFALGAGNQLVAVPAAADYPAAARALRRVDPGDVEAILAERPDLVLATTAGSDPRAVERLRSLGIPVFTADVTSFVRLAEACRLAGRAVGRSDQGERVADAISARCERLARRAAPLPHRAALFVVWWDPLIAAAPGTFHDDLLRRAALDNLASAASGRYPRLDPETLLDRRLEVVVAPDERDVRAGYESVLRSPAGARLASGATRVLWLPADAANRPGPRLPDALEALVAAREKEETGSGVNGEGSGPHPPDDGKAGPGVRGPGSDPRPPNDVDATPQSARRTE